MMFWLERVGAGFLSYVFIGWGFLLIYLAIQWFLQATDVVISYDWTRKGATCRPTFSIRNRSRSRTYLLAKIEYSNGPDKLAWFDNQSLMGKELTPGSCNEFTDIAPVRNTSSIAECMQLRVAIRLQNGRKLWLSAQTFTALQRAAIRLRDFVDSDSRQ